MKMATMKSGLGALTLLPGLAMAAPAVADKADNAFMMICTALVLFMTIPGIALFYGGLIRGKNVLSMLTQVIVTFGLVCVLWVIYGYTLAFGTGGSFFGSFDWVMLKNIELKALMGTFYQYIHVAFQGSFACITVGLIVGALAERIRFSAVLIFVVVWMTLSYVPIAHMVWGGGLLATHGALDFAGGTVVHINAAVAGLVGAYMMGKRVGFGKEAFKPHNLPMVFTGTAILYVGWFGFNAGSASAANEMRPWRSLTPSWRPLRLSWRGPLANGLCAANLHCWAPAPGNCRSGWRYAGVWLYRCRRGADRRYRLWPGGYLGRDCAETLAACG